MGANLRTNNGGNQSRKHVMTSWHEVTKKKKNSYFLYTCVFLFPVRYVRLCTYLYRLVHFSYLLLCISPWLRVSIYYDTMRRHTYVRCFGLNSALSSHFYYFSSSSTTFFSFVTSFLPPTRQFFPSQHIFTQIHLPFHRQHLPTPFLCLSTTLPILFLFFINFHISLSHLKLAANNTTAKATTP